MIVELSIKGNDEGVSFVIDDHIGIEDDGVELLEKGHSSLVQSCFVAHISGHDKDVVVRRTVSNMVVELDACLFLSECKINIVCRLDFFGLLIVYFEILELFL